MKIFTRACTVGRRPSTRIEVISYRSTTITLLIATSKIIITPIATTIVATLATLATTPGTTAFLYKTRHIVYDYICKYSLKIYAFRYNFAGRKQFLMS
jgi:hypothetical protein